MARFRPSGIMELTATPDTVKTPSNVLHSVSAAELKAEEMIKLPIVLETEPNWQQCLADAIARREELHNLADEERRRGANYLRPVVLIQSEPRRQGIETLDFDRVKQELIDNHRIPAEEIIVATGEEKGLEKIDKDYQHGIADEDCPVKYVITQRALAEGWDCPFAYILVSMASLHSATAVEQLLGRVLRQPEAKRREAHALNQSYVFVVSRNFAETAGALRDSLVENAGFDRKEVAEFITAAKAEQGRLDLAAHPGRISFWVRKLVRKEGCSFFLQKADGRFYPDFLCRLPNGSILAVEYKGADRWGNAEDDRLIGGLWEELSDGRCRFVMVKDKKWDLIEEKIRQ